MKVAIPIFSAVGRAVRLAMIVAFQTQPRMNIATPDQRRRHRAGGRRRIRGGLRGAPTITRNFAKK
jgi:hypothetical protein